MDIKKIINIKILNFIRRNKMSKTQLQTTEDQYLVQYEKNNFSLKDIGLNEVASEIFQAYSLAKKSNDKERIDQYKNDFFQLACIDNDMLRVKLNGEENSWSNDYNFSLQRHGLELSDPRIEEVVNKKFLKFKDNVDIKYPQKIKKYKGKIPFNVYKKMDKINESFKDKNIEYYVADVKRDPDPLFLVQLDGKKEQTFVLGVWE